MRELIKIYIKKSPWIYHSVFLLSETMYPLDFISGYETVLFFAFDNGGQTEARLRRPN